MIEGQLIIDVKRSSSDTTVTITSSRPLHASQILVGKSPEQALKIVPLLFNICGIAQSYNAFRVLIHQKNYKNSAQQILVLTETLKEHLLRIFLDAPQLLNIKASDVNLSFVAQLVKQMQTSILGGQPIFDFENNATIQQAETQALIEEIETFLEKHLFGMPINQWQQINTYLALIEWSTKQQSIATKAINTIIKNDWSSQAAISLQPLPVLPVKELEFELGNGNAKNFIAQPRWQQKTYETTPLTRHRNNSLIIDLQEKHGNGLLTRWLARLVEVSLLPLQIRTLLANKSATTESSQIAQIEAARGRLIHRAVVENNKVKTYQIVAPTEWNFHPNGVVVESLKNIKTKTNSEYQKIAHCVINAIDPCVGYELRVS